MNLLLFKLSKIIAKITMRHKGPDAPAKLIEKLSFSQYSKGLKKGELWITHDPEVVKAYNEDPYANLPFSAKFYYDLMSGVMPAYKKANLANIDKNIPLMLIAGNQDAFSKNAKLIKKLEKQYEKLHISDLSVKIYPGMRHEVHNELHNEQVLADIVNFYNHCKK